MNMEDDGHLPQGKIYDKDNPAPEYTNLMRGIMWRKSGRNKKYRENYDKISWSKDKESDECTSSKESTKD